MDSNKKEVLKAGLNRMLEDGYRKIQARHLLVYSKHDINVIEDSISDWQKRGIVKLIKPYNLCGPDDYCIELLQFIGQKSPIKGYMNWE